MEAHSFKPYIPSDQSPAELTARALIVGALLGVVFAASSVYLALKVGLTVSASIPVAVLSITILRALGRGTILENNIVQTTGSAGESIAAGVAFTLPSLLLMGQDLEMFRVLLIALLGGLLGVLMMIPLREGLIVKEHGHLTYPEGTACAEVLIVGEQGGTQARIVFFGFGLGFVYSILNLVLKLWKDTATFAVEFWGRFKGATLSIEVTPPMLGVGYIIGKKTAANMMAGGLLAFVVLIPAIHLFGDAVLTPMYPATTLIATMTPHELRNAYVLYIGAGAVATGGIISLLQSLPTIVSAFRRGFSNFKTASVAATERTNRDLPLSLVIGGAVAILVAIAAAPVLQINAASAVLIVLFAFFFVTVSSRITGEIGSSSNPISGMTVATLLITCLLFWLVGWTGISYRAMALSTAAIVCVAASVAGATSQDLKTGFLLGSTPRAQQIAIFVGVLTSAVFIGWTLLGINKAYTTYRAVDYPAYTAPTLDAHESHDGHDYRVAHVLEPTDTASGIIPTGRYLADGDGKLRFLIDPGIGGTDPDKPKLDAPKARLFSLIIDGILTQKLPWGLVLLGVCIALIIELLGVSSLPFAVGLYLPLSTSAPIYVGGLLRGFADRRSGSSEAEAESSPGVLMASGLIAGGAIAGLVAAGVQGFGADKTFDLSRVMFGLGESDIFALVIFGGLSAALGWSAMRNKA